MDLVGLSGADRSSCSRESRRPRSALPVRYSAQPMRRRSVFPCSHRGYSAMLPELSSCAALCSRRHRRSEPLPLVRSGLPVLRNALLGNVRRPCIRRERRRTCEPGCSRTNVRPTADDRPTGLRRCR